MGSTTTLFEYIKTIVPTKEYNEKEKEQILQEILTLIICKLVKVGDETLKNTGKNSHDQFMPPNKKLPAITIKDYLCRLMKYSPCSKECFISSLLYIDRLLLECGLSINSYNIHRILITTLLISTKYLDDIFYNNEFYSQVGGVGLKEMNTLELDFLKLLKFSAFCSIPLFNEYQQEIENTKIRFSLGPNAPINQTLLLSTASNIITINKLPISSITDSPSSSPRINNMNVPSSSNQTVPNSPNSQIMPHSPTNGCAIINVNSNYMIGNGAPVVPQTNNNNIINNSNSSAIVPTGSSANANNTNNTANNNGYYQQRRGSCDYETRLPSSSNEKSTFHTNCAA